MLNGVDVEPLTFGWSLVLVDGYKTHHAGPASGTQTIKQRVILCSSWAEHLDESVLLRCLTAGWKDRSDLQSQTLPSERRCFAPFHVCNCSTSNCSNPNNPSGLRDWFAFPGKLSALSKWFLSFQTWSRVRVASWVSSCLLLSDMTAATWASFICSYRRRWYNTVQGDVSGGKVTNSVYTKFSKFVF